jgi:hypothetical protein
VTNQQYLLVALALAIGFTVGFIVARRRVNHVRFQNRGELLLMRSVQEQLSGPNYHLLNHLTLQMKDGTTQVDHVLVSRFGVFVIETKDYGGWIFANPNHGTWTQVYFKRKSKFQNPIFQNFRHVKAVQDILDFLPQEAVKSVVVFTGDAEFKTEVPPGVYSLPAFIDHLQSQTKEILSENRVQFCVGRLEVTRQSISGQTDVEHIESLLRRHSSLDPPS